MFIYNCTIFLVYISFFGILFQIKHIYIIQNYIQTYIHLLESKKWISVADWNANLN